MWGGKMWREEIEYVLVTNGVALSYTVGLNKSRKNIHEFPLCEK